MRKARHPISYLVILLVTSWVFSWPVALYSAGLVSVQPPAFFAPLVGQSIILVALALALWEARAAGIRGMFSGTLILPRTVGVWGLAFLPALLIVVGILLGGVLFTRSSFTFSPSVTPVLVGTLISAWTEEVVWRGFITPRLLHRFTPARASLALGLIWMFWHLPFYWYEGYSAWGPLGWFAWAPFYLVYTYVLTWLYVRSRGSVLLTTVSHVAVNWVITWMDPFWLENAGSLFAAAALVPILWRWFPRRLRAQAG